VVEKKTDGGIKNKRSDNQEQNLEQDVQVDQEVDMGEEGVMEQAEDEDLDLISLY